MSIWLAFLLASYWPCQTDWLQEAVSHDTLVEIVVLLWDERDPCSKVMNPLQALFQHLLLLWWQSCNTLFTISMSTFPTILASSSTSESSILTLPSSKYVTCSLTCTEKLTTGGGWDANMCNIGSGTNYPPCCWLNIHSTAIATQSQLVITKLPCFQHNSPLSIQIYQQSLPLHLSFSIPHLSQIMDHYYSWHCQHSTSTSTLHPQRIICMVMP